MPDTIRERLGAALFAALAPLAQTYTLWQGETKEPEESELQVVNLLLEDHRPIDKSTNAWRYEMTVLVDAWLNGTDGPTLEAAINAFYGAALALVHADPSLGGLAIDVTEEEFLVTRDTLQGHGHKANATLVLGVEWMQSESDATELAP